MSTALAAFANATVTFKVPVSSSKGATGNRVFETKDLKVACWLKQARRPDPENVGAGNIEETYVVGRCISPSKLPDTILPETIADAVIGGVKYKYRYQGKIESPFYPERTILGQKLDGFVTVANEWGNANGS